MIYANFLNRGKECFGSALANYFDINREEGLAEKVYGRFRQHPFVAADGSMHALVCTRMVYDLTEGRYRGVFQYGSFKGDMQESLRGIIGHQAEQAWSVIEEERKEGRLIGGLESFGYVGQALVLQGLPGMEIQHWIVDCDDGTVINDGRIKKIVDAKKFFSTLNAVLRIQPA